MRRSSRSPTIDDVARGLIVTAMHHTLFRDESVLKPFHTYLSYMHYARTESGRYRNFMSYDRKWLETDGSDDSQGRVLWALGYVVDHPPEGLSRQLCEQLFEQAVPVFESVGFMRSLAFATLGCHYYLRRKPDASNIERFMRDVTEKIAAAFDANASDDWPWFEDEVTYENGRIPQALILAGLQFKDEALIQLGCRTLDWLLQVQTAENGHISIIGNDGWLQRGMPKAQFDQQPVEISGLIGACKAAYRASGDTRYLKEMRRCFDWFLGTNDGGVSLIDFKSKGCYDGLLQSGCNANQGAESLLSWLLSLLTMHEMQSGDPTSAG